jgi:hypothetical protein
MPGKPDAGQRNPLKNSMLMQGLCKKGSVAKALKIPGGLADSDTSNELMGFLKSNTKYITFGSNAPTTLTWTSTITDALSVSASEDASQTNGGSVEVFADMDAFGGKINSNIDAGSGRQFGLLVGKTSDSSHGFTRTVTVNLDDKDLGNINFLLDAVLLHLS